MGLFSGLFGGGGSSSTQVVNTNPWKPQQKPLISGFNFAKDIYHQGPHQYFPGSTIAPFSDVQQEALGATADRARAGNPLLPGANQQVQQTMRGDYLNAGNPYISQLTDSIASQVMPQVNSAFAGGGR